MDCPDPMAGCGRNSNISQTFFVVHLLIYIERVPQRKLQGHIIYNKITEVSNKRRKRIGEEHKKEARIGTKMCTLMYSFLPGGPHAWL